ncbi:Carboxylesterase [Lachnellula subtilissima]|uniref:Carboxylesterase n=1 Tax=Lachnellula subtilissima TaxID=602034 RepID=A0A8H8RUN6_9HELO|nr:Carboxylesterase [Lachnellula subtilissima]
MTLVTKQTHRGLGLAKATFGTIRSFIYPKKGKGSSSNMKNNRPRVVVRQGTVIGIEVKVQTDASLNVILEEFLGVPFALSTTGKRRFSPPVPLPASEEKEFDAGSWGPRCPSGEDDGTSSEDCLNLNIFRPKLRDEHKKLPVLVYVHGGSFNFGSGNARQIDDLVAWSEKPMIGISFNYRVGAFGFLNSRFMASEGLLNVGLKDQEFALRWVKENIEAFGGDSGDVTFMGSSAGAHSVGHHLMHNPDESPLFHKAIIESGATTARAVYPYDNALHEEQFQAFLSHLNLQNAPENQIIPTLRLLPTSRIKTASEAVFDKYSLSIRWPFQPVIDGPGGMIPTAPIHAWRSEKYHKIPILTGFNTNEGASFVPWSLATTAQFTSFFRTMLPGLSEEDLRELDNLYPDPVSNPTSKYVEHRRNLGKQYKRVEQAYAHFAYIAPVRQTAQYAAAAEEEEMPVYLYHFAVDCSVNGGADHGTHSSFVTYARQVRNVSPTIDEIAGTMHAYWTSFVTTGDPNTVKGRWGTRPEWPRYVAGGKGKKMLFGDGNDEVAGFRNKGVVAQVVDDVWAKEECEYWWERTEKFES